MTTILTAGDKNLDVIHFCWPIVDWCNYSCSYCCAADKMADNFDKNTSPSKHKLVLARLKKMKSPFTMEIVGGEPTLHPHLVEIIKELDKMEHCKLIEVITNLSKPLKYLEKFNIPGLVKTNIIASYHPEHHNEKFMRKALTMSTWTNIEFSVDISIPSDITQWDLVDRVIKELVTNKVECCFNFLYATRTWTPNYPDAVYKRFLEPFKDQTEIEYKFDDGITRMVREEEIIEKEYNRFQGYDCITMIYEILPDGTIVNQCTGRRLPMLITEESTKVKEICPAVQCTCDKMFHYYKEKRDT